MRFNFLLPLAAASVVFAAPNPVAEPAPQETSGLLTELPTILTGAQDLLGQQNVDNLNIIIGNAAKLLSDSNLAVLQDILNNAHTLLTKDFVANTTTLISDATPVCPVNCLAGRCANFSSWWRMSPSCWVESWERWVNRMMEIA